MADLFAEILAKEMKQAGMVVPAARSLPAPQLLPSSPEERRLLPAMQVDQLNFSGKARSLSASMRHFNEDKYRLWRRDSGIIAGNANTGYLWKSEEGIQGHMTFSTNSGAVVEIRAGIDNESGDGVFISVQKDGRRFVFDIETLGEAAKGPAVTPFLALESVLGEALGNHADATLSSLFSYDARAMPVEMPVGASIQAPFTV